jgi:multidrug resistance efflux pump
MDSLPPIPTPVSQRWREFRIQVLPIIVFLGTVVVIFFLWRNYIVPTGIVGEVEAVRANITTTTEGTVTRLLVERFDSVSSNQELAEVTTTDPAVLEIMVKAMAADLKLMEARMGLDKVRNQDAFTQMRLSLLNERISLELAQIRLQQTEIEYQRNVKLHQAKLIPDGMPGDANSGRFVFGLDVAKRDRDMAQAEVTQRTKAVTDLEKALQQMEASGQAQIAPVDPVIGETIKAKETELRAISKPATLRAPIAGVVSAVFKQAGEKAVRGDIILTIASPEASHIIGYIRQPIAEPPTTNQLVQVRTRTMPNQVANARILKVGVQLELINPLLVGVDSNRVELGLPVLVGAPAGLKLLPGQPVDLILEANRK